MDDGRNREQRRRDAKRAAKRDVSVVYAMDGARLGYTSFQSHHQLNSARICDTPNEAKLFDYSDVRGECPHELTSEVVVSVWNTDGLWWPSVACSQCKQLLGRKDPWFSIEGDLQTLGKGTELMRAEWQFWHASGWPREGKPKFSLEAPGKRMGLPMVMWVNPYLLFEGWVQKNVDTWFHPKCPEGLIVVERNAAPEDAQWVSISASVERDKDEPSKVVALRDPKLDVSKVWVVQIDRRGNGEYELSRPFESRAQAVEAALTLLFDLQASLAATLSRSVAKVREEQAKAAPQIVLPPGMKG